MRTIRIKLYKFDELTSFAKTHAISEEVKKFRKCFNVNTPDTFTEIEKEKYEAAKRLDAYQFEFTINGDRY